MDHEEASCRRRPALEDGSNGEITSSQSPGPFSIQPRCPAVPRVPTHVRPRLPTTYHSSALVQRLSTSTYTRYSSTSTSLLLAAVTGLRSNSKVEPPSDSHPPSIPFEHTRLCWRLSHIVHDFCKLIFILMTR